jgi:hypothetical protein
MTVVLVALVISAGLAVAGAWLLLAGRREELTAAALRARERPLPPTPGYRRKRALSVHADDATVPKPATPAAIDIQAAGRARLEVALANARARLSEQP